MSNLFLSGPAAFDVAAAAELVQTAADLGTVAENLALVAGHLSDAQPLQEGLEALRCEGIAADPEELAQQAKKYQALLAGALAQIPKPAWVKAIQATQTSFFAPTDVATANARRALDLGPALGSYSTISKAARGKNIPTNLSAASEQITRSLRARYDFYPVDHSLTQYVKGLVRKISNGDVATRVFVTKAWDEIQALALPNGTIIVSESLIKFCQYEEELLFILAHEYNHVVRQHSKRRIELWEKASRETGTKRDQWLQAIGMDRVHEYEADIRANLDLAKQGINPYGGTVFFNRLAEKEAKKDLEHGSPIDRSLNIGVLTRLYDLAVLTTNLTPIPPHIHNSESAPWRNTYAILVEEGMFKEGGNYYINSERHRAVEVASFPVLLEALPFIAGRLEQIRETGHFAQFRQREDQKILGRILERIREYINNFFAGKTKAEQFFLFVGCLYLDVGVDLLSVTDSTNPIYAIAEEWVAALNARSDFQRFTSVLTKRNFAELGIYRSRDPTPLLTGIAQTALEAGLFTDKSGKLLAQDYFNFCIAWVKRLVRPPEQGKIFEKLLILAIPSLEGPEALEEFLKQAAQQSLPISQQRLRETALSGSKKEEEDPVSQLIRAGEPVGATLEFAKQMQEKPQEEIAAALQTIAARYGTEAIGFFNGLFSALLDGWSPKESTKEKRRRLEKNLPGDIEVMEQPRQFDTVAFSIPALQRPSPVQRMIAILEFISQLNLPEEIAGDLYLDLGSLIFKKVTLEEFSTVFQFVETIAPVVVGNLGAIFSLALENLIKQQDKASFMASFASAADLISRTQKYIEGDGIDLPSFLDQLFATYVFDLTRLQDAQFLYQLSFVLQEPVLAMRLREKAVATILAHADEEEAFAFLFEERRSAYNTSVATKEGYLDSHIHRLERLEQLKKILLARLDSSPEPSMGKLVIMDELEEAFKGKKDLFKILMEVSRNETVLRKALADIIMPEFGDEIDESAYAMAGVDRILQKLYNLDPLAIHAVVRNLLTGENGLLRSEKSRQWLLDYFFAEHVTPEPQQKTILNILRDSLMVIMKEADLETLYFAFAPLIAARILRPSLNPFDWEEVMKKYFPDKEMRRDLFQLYEKAKRGEAKSGQTGGSGFGEVKILELLGKETKPAEQKLNPIGLVLELASKLGSPGVRFLQILGQFVAIPKEYESEFQKVYDGLHGQSKLTAYLLLKREWPEMPGEIAEINETVGGGSLMTTFRATTLDGRQQVIKVLNPNAEYHLEIVYKLLEATLQTLAAEKGGGYIMARAALSDIKAWIAQDIHFGGFLAKDERFYLANHSFQPAGFKYRIKVPQSLGPDNQYFKREEYVEGSNLTQMEQLRSDGHDVKAIVSLIVKNYWEQIQKGLVHSDVHPGNFRVTLDREVAILDRNFFLELDETDRQLLAELQAKIDLLQTNGGDLVKQIQRHILNLKARGAQVPLKITLLLKNINALECMAKSAGFADLRAAFFYKSLSS